MKESSFPYSSLPALLKEGNAILAKLRAMDVPEAKRFYRCSDAIASSVVARFQNLDLCPAIFRYDGVAYVSLSPEALPQVSLSFLQEHLRIFSAAYGLLLPMDGIPFYRLDYGDPYKVEGQTLARYFGEKIATLIDAPGPYLNLASQEYFEPLRKYLDPSEVIDVSFFLEKGEKRVSSSVFSKQCRGAMAREIALAQAKTKEEILSLTPNGLLYDPFSSTNSHWVFILKEEPEKEKKHVNFDW